MTWPMITSSTSSSGTFERLSASRMAMAPSSGALSDESAPRNLPIGVRAAPTMTGVRDLSGMIEVNPSPYHSEATRHAFVLIQLAQSAKGDRVANAFDRRNAVLPFGSRRTPHQINRARLGLE